MTMSTWISDSKLQLQEKENVPTHQQRSVLEDRLPVWSSLGEDDDQNDILELGDRKDGEVLQGGDRIFVLCAHLFTPVPSNCFQHGDHTFRMCEYFSYLMIPVSLKEASSEVFL